MALQVHLHPAQAPVALRLGSECLAAACPQRSPPPSPPVSLPAAHAQTPPPNGSKRSRAHEDPDSGVFLTTQSRRRSQRNRFTATNSMTGNGLDAVVERASRTGSKNSRTVPNTEDMTRHLRKRISHVHIERYSYSRGVWVFVSGRRKCHTHLHAGGHPAEDGVLSVQPSCWR